MLLASLKNVLLVYFLILSFKLPLSSSVDLKESGFVCLPHEVVPIQKVKRSFF